MYWRLRVQIDRQRREIVLCGEETRRRRVLGVVVS